MELKKKNSRYHTIPACRAAIGKLTKEIESLLLARDSTHGDPKRWFTLDRHLRLVSQKLDLIKHRQEELIVKEMQT